MRLTLLAATLAGLIAGVVGGVIVSVIDDGGGGPSETVAEAVSQAVAEAVAEALPVAAEPQAAPLPINLAVERVLPGVVIIDVELPPIRDADGTVLAQGALGTGLVLNNDGYILTNEHVIRDGQRLTVILANGEERSAQVVGTDFPFTDIAVLKIAPGGLTPVPFGASSDLTFGETVLALGNALLIDEPSVTVGVVSNPDTSYPRETYLQEHLIQTDAALNHGNSGGALINLQGEVVGLTTTVLRETDAGQFVDGIGFALQADTILPIAASIIETGDFPRSELGVVEERTVTAGAAAQFDLAVEHGSFLVEITQMGVLAEAGLRPGDIVLRIGGLEISEDLPYLNVLARTEPEVPVEIEYMDEDGVRHVVTVTPELRDR